MHAFAHALNVTFSISFVGFGSPTRFGPGTDLQDMTVNLLMVIGLLPFQVVSSYERTETKKLWARLVAALVCGGLLLAALEEVSGSQWRDQAALVLMPGAALLAVVSILLAIMLRTKQVNARRKVQATVRRVVSLVHGSRSVVPVFLAGFVLTIFSPDITRAVAAVPGRTIFCVSVGAVAIAAALHDRDGHAYVERFMAMASLWFLLSLSVFYLDVYLIANNQLLEWGAVEWTECAGLLGLRGKAPECVEVVLFPRLKIAGLLGALGTVSVMAQSLVPPVPRREP